VKRNAGIDLLRGFSISMVVIHHVAIRVHLPRSRFWNGFAFNGYESVFIFFVISGFVIARRFLPSLDVREFYRRRASRILPLLFALIVVLSALHLLGVRDYVVKQPLPRVILSAIGLHLNWYEGRTGWLPGGWDVLWSLSIEEVFYLAFPLVVLLLRPGLLLAALTLLFALSLPHWRASIVGNEIWQEKAYLPGMAAISLGVFGALIVDRFRAPWLGLVGVAGIIAVFFFEDVLWKFLGNGTMLVLTFSALFAVLGSAWASFDRARWLQSFGRLSYEIYLTHMFVVFAVVRIMPSYWAYPLAIVLCWLLGAAVSRAMQRFVSAPAKAGVLSLQ
jgi:peptidoglycan/LPS O-acetylase OafA/YrhL